MKYFHKLFFSILLILTLAVTAVESAAVSFSLENSFSREKTKALAQHQLVKYSIQAAVLSSAQDGGVSAAELPIIGERRRRCSAAADFCILPETEARSTTQSAVGYRSGAAGGGLRVLPRRLRQLRHDRSSGGEPLFSERGRIRAGDRAVYQRRVPGGR